MKLVSIFSKNFDTHFVFFYLKLTTYEFFILNFNILIFIKWKTPSKLPKRSNLSVSIVGWSILSGFIV